MANVAIVGASRGIGLELAKQHAEAGDRVFALCRSTETAEKLKTLASGSGGKISVHKGDIADDASMRSAVASLDGQAVDTLYIVAGVIGTMAPELESTDWDAFDDAINIMLKGPLRALNAFMPHLKPGSKVINFSSQLAASTWPYGGFYAYSAAKAGLNRLMRAVALDLKDKGIVIGLVHPGYVQTDMGGPNAEITPTESASGIRKLAADWTIEESGAFKKWNGETHPW